MSIGSIVEERSIVGISLKLSSLFEDMENINAPSSVDTSLDLNAKPLRLFDDGLKQEGARNFIEFVKKIPVKEDEANPLLEELNRVNAENKKLTEMLTAMCENYNALRNQFMEYTSKNSTAEADSSGSRKRKSEEITTNNNNNNHNGNMDGTVGACESSSSDEDSSCKKPKEQHLKPKISRVYVQTEASDTSLIVKDGYQWRKYGQKVTRDNPYPRAYFKCSFAPTCPVKKKVQRSVEDHSILVATYEGEHKHPEFSKIEATASPSAASTQLGSVPCTTGHSSSSAPPTITLDLTKPSIPNHDGRIIPSCKMDSSSPELQRSLVEQMASSLTRDPNFRAALAAAISGRMLQPH